MKTLLLSLILAILSTLHAEVVSSYHPPKEPTGLYIVDMQINNSFMTYRVYCPTQTVRNITKGTWNKARKVQDADRIAHYNGLLLDAFDQVCHLRTDSLQANTDEASVSKRFLIAKSTKSYKEAKRFARKLSIKTGIKIDYRGLNYNKKLMLSESYNQCLDDGFEYPCYVARGRYDDGVYISIEYSGAYQNFRDGYYIVMVASGESANTILKQIRQTVKDAYVKRSKVYMGCIH